MIATISPAGCGGRHRHLAASALFTVGALASAALLGALCGLAGAVLGGGRATVLAGVVAVLAALRESVLRGLPLPQLRRQVPERWRRELPLAVWPLAYGAGLGAGILTFQPVATLWVALAAAASLAEPLRAALCLSAFGAARAAMATLPGLRGDAAEQVIVRRTRTMRRVNAAALAAAALVLVAAPAPAATLPLGPGSQLDPSVSAGVLAYTQRNGGAVRVVIAPPRGRRVELAGASSPALDGALVAVQQDGAVRVVRWTDQVEVARVDHALRPALRRGVLAFVRRTAAGSQLIIRRLAGGPEVVVASAAHATISRPSLYGGRVAYTVTRRHGSTLYTVGIDGRRRHVLVDTRVGALGAPALASRWVVYTETRARSAVLVARRLRDPVSSELLFLNGRLARLWTTALVGRTTYVTRWSTRTGLARIVRLRF